MRPYEKKYLNECYQEMQQEHDACGIGLVVNIDGRKEYRTLDDALSIVEKRNSRGLHRPRGLLGLYRQISILNTERDDDV